MCMNTKIFVLCLLCVHGNSHVQGLDKRKLDELYIRKHYPMELQFRSLENLSAYNMDHVSNSSTKFSSQKGANAYLNCSVSKTKEGMVSWIRLKDYQLLTVGTQVYVQREKFYVAKEEVNNGSAYVWSLIIKNVAESDEGFYECHFSSYPPMRQYLHLIVIEAFSEIIGGVEKFIKMGNILELICSFHFNTAFPEFVFWFHNERLINYDENKEVMFANEFHRSIIRIKEITSDKSGNYTCVPSNIRPSSQIVHVLNEEKLAVKYNHCGSYHKELFVAIDLWVMLIILRGS